MKILDVKEIEKNGNSLQRDLESDELLEACLCACGAASGSGGGSGGGHPKEMSQ